MRTYGTGSVHAYTTKHGLRWRAVLPPLATGGKRKTKSYPTREEAEQALAIACAALADGGASPSRGVTLGEYGAQWLARCRHRSVKDDRGRWQRFIVPRDIARMSLDAIKAGHIKRLIESVARTRKLKPAQGKRYKHEASTELVSAQTVRHVYGMLRRCLHEAIVDGHITENPCFGYRLPKNPERQRLQEARTHLTLEEIGLIETAAIPDKYRLIYLFAIYTGCREGELWGLRWQDVEGLDTHRPVATVRHSYEGPTKANKTRKFPLTRSKSSRLDTTLCFFGAHRNFLHL